MNLLNTLWDGESKERTETKKNHFENQNHWESILDLRERERARGYIFKLKFQFISKYKIKTIKKQILGKTQLQTKTLSFWTLKRNSQST